MIPTRRMRLAVAEADGQLSPTSAFPYISNADAGITDGIPDYVPDGATDSVISGETNGNAGVNGVAEDSANVTNDEWTDAVSIGSLESEAIVETDDEAGSEWEDAPLYQQGDMLTRLRNRFRGVLPRRRT
ncbi:hypothetical protein PG988_007236 [Apiospora saccharicola]